MSAAQELFQFFCAADRLNLLLRSTAKPEKQRDGGHASGLVKYVWEGAGDASGWDCGGLGGFPRDGG